MDYLRFLNLARGSLFELRTQIAIANDLGYTQQQDDLFTLVDEVSRILVGLIRSLRAKVNQP